MDPTVAALLRKRKRYLERAAAVTAELERLGYVEASETTMLEAPPERAVPPRPRPRRSTP